MRPPAPAGTLRLLIADDHRIFAESLQIVLSGDERIDVVGLAHDGEEAVALARSLCPDIVLMDVNMPRMNGIEATRRIRALGLDTHVLILTGEAPLDSHAAIRAGASAFLRKDGRLGEVMEVLFAVASLTRAIQVTQAPV